MVHSPAYDTALVGDKQISCKTQGKVSTHKSFNIQYHFWLDQHELLNLNLPKKILFSHKMPLKLNPAPSLAAVTTLEKYIHNERPTWQLTSIRPTKQNAHHLPPPFSRVHIDETGDGARRWPMSSVCRKTSCNFKTQACMENWDVKKKKGMSSSQPASTFCTLMLGNGIAPKWVKS